MLTFLGTSPRWSIALWRVYKQFDANWQAEGGLNSTHDEKPRRVIDFLALLLYLLYEPCSATSPANLERTAATNGHSKDAPWGGLLEWAALIGQNGWQQI